MLIQHGVTQLPAGRDDVDRGDGWISWDRETHAAREGFSAPRSAHCHAWMRRTLSRTCSSGSDSLAAKLRSIVATTGNRGAQR